MHILSLSHPRLSARRRRVRPRYVAGAAALTLALVFRKWIYCLLLIAHCFLTWNLRDINYVGMHDDGFTLDFDGLPPPPTVNITRLLAARRLVEFSLSPFSFPSKPLPPIPFADLAEFGSLAAAHEFVAATDAALAWGPTPRPPPLSTDNESSVVPPILHQVLVGMRGPAPQKWTDASNACSAIHPDWTVMRWDDAAAEEFIKREHAWFYDTWMNYRFNIQKADSLRYLLLYTYGGVYLDMDIQCRRPLDPLRKFPFLAIAAHPVGVSNSFIMAAPKSDFFLRLVQNLELFNRYFFSSYPTVMISTGCMYVSVHHNLHPQRDQLKVLGGLHNRINGAVTTPLFKHLGSSSWHGGDARLFVKLGKWLKKVPIFGGGSEKQDASVEGVFPPPAAVPIAQTPPSTNLRPVDDVPLLPFLVLMGAVVACLASFQLYYLRRRRVPRMPLLPAAPIAKSSGCKADNSVVVLISEKEAWLD
ncbi:hypothetical protein HDU90_002282 [Geranomyces variabilis]|nr:hypothetical protein HDU90_002282 [Geranomyces variabilis]